MSKRNFRITVCLRNLLNDHRSTALIFVNRRMHYVRDLEQHVGNIFNIKDFYFMSGNQYLPSEEDIRIIQPDEQLKAVPNSKRITTSNHPSAVIDEVLNFSERKGCAKSTNVENSVAETDENVPKICTRKVGEYLTRYEKIECEEASNTADFLNRTETFLKQIRDTVDDKQRDGIDMTKSSLDKKESSKQICAVENSEEAQNSKLLKESEDIENSTNVQPSEEICELQNSKKIQSGLKPSHKITSKEAPEVDSIKEVQSIQKKLDKSKLINLDDSFVTNSKLKKQRTSQKVESTCSSHNKIISKNVQNDISVNRARPCPEFSKKENKKNKKDKSDSACLAAKKTTKTKQAKLMRTGEEVNEMLFEWFRETSDDETRNNKVDVNESKCKTADNFENDDSKKRKSSAEDFNENDVEVKSDNVKNKALVVKKRKTDTICFDLPKQTNIVKSVIVSSTPKHVDVINSNNMEFETTPKNEKPDEPTFHETAATNESGISDSTSPKRIFYSAERNVSHPPLKGDANLKGSNEEISLVKFLLNDHEKNNNITSYNESKSRKLKDTYEIELSDSSLLKADHQKLSENDSSPLAITLDLTDKCELKEIDSILDEHQKPFDNESSTSKLASSLTSDCDENFRVPDFVTKRKRKRHRKHKSKTREISPSSVKSEYVFRPPSTIAAPSIHIKFDDPEQAVDVNDEATALEEKKDIKSDSEEKKVEINGSSEKVGSLDKEVLERVIQQSPSMSKMLPRSGDVISFKVLRMNNNYEPEVSNPIIGKVLNFNTDTTEIRIFFISGKDECREPQGIFSLENEETEIPATSEKTFQWKTLLEPRLLFP